MLQDVEGLLEVWITVAVVGTEPVAGKMSLGGFIQAGGKLVGLCVPGESVSAPASGVVSHSAAAGCIDVDADDEGVVRFAAVASPVGSHRALSGPQQSVSNIDVIQEVR